VKEPFIGHLEELRHRLISCLAILALGTVISYPLAKPLLLRMKHDLMGAIPLVIIDPTEAVVAYVNVSFVLGFLLALPAMAYQFWAFIWPALFKRERRALLYLVVPSVSLFFLGLSFGYFFLIPTTLDFMIGEAAPLATPMVSLAAAASLISNLLLALGIVFQWPLISAALARIGVLGADDLARYRRHAIVLIVLVAGIITPDPTIVPQLVLSIPMIALFEAGILTARMAGR
jgi:sec-independent protein translocase protein TatC